MFLTLVALAAVLAVGCGGGEKKNGENASTGGGDKELTAQQIVDKSQAAMQGIKSASFALDLSLAIKGDTAKMTDEQVKTIAQSPITIQGQGKVGNEPQKADLGINAKFAGQSLDIGLRMDADKIWVQFMDAWYEVPKDMLTGAIAGASPAPTESPGALTQQLQEQLSSMGLDPAKWSKELTLVGTESLDGAETYHIKQAIDVSTMVDDVLKASGSLSALTGDTSATDPEEMQKAAQTLKESLKDLTVDYWYEKDTFLMRKTAVAVNLDFTGQADAQAEGVDAIELAFTLSMADFDKPVTVEVPADVKPFDQLMNALMSSGALNL